MERSPDSYTAPRKTLPVSAHRSQTLGSTWHRLPIFEALRHLQPSTFKCYCRESPARWDRGRIPALPTLPWIPGGAQSPQGGTGPNKQQTQQRRTAERHSRSGEHEPLQTRRAGKDRGHGWSRALPIPSHPSPALMPARGGL